MSSSSARHRVVSCPSEDPRQRDGANPKVKATGFAIAVAITALGPGCGGRDVSGVDASDAVAPEAASCLILASNYDQSCAADTDCMAVREVPSCPATLCFLFCPTGFISNQAADAYMAAFSDATAGLSMDAGYCNCPERGIPCCRSGKCQGCH